MKKKGFTLIELMIVVAIIAILAAAALPAFGDQIKKSKDSKAVQMMGNMRSQISMVQADLEGMAPTAAEALSCFMDAGSTGVKGVVGVGFTVDVKGIQGFDKASSTAGERTLKAGTPAGGIAWTYSVDNSGDKWNISFNGVSDTKKRNWAEY